MIIFELCTLKKLGFHIGNILKEFLKSVGEEIPLDYCSKFSLYPFLRINSLPQMNPNLWSK